MKSRMRDVTISEVLNGFVVNVGCQTVVFTDIDQLVGSLKAYAQNPKQVEKDFGWDVDQDGAASPQTSYYATSLGVPQAVTTVGTYSPSPYDCAINAPRRG